MKPTLSIITPCYNSEKTLRETILSCFNQGLKDHEFEIIMVDDGSKDGTRALMRELAEGKPNIKCIFHEKNKGGGAARNTGIKEAAGEIIYCLDSDNFFAPKSVRPMLDYINEHHVDGAAFYERRFFVGTDSKHFKPTFFPFTDRNPEIKDLFLEAPTFLDNFFYKKSAYLKTKGYPEHHGFDTQSFELRYLSAGNTVGICPNSIFYHRFAHADESYFEREFNNGNFSINFFLCIEDVLPLFSDDALELILNFDIFKRCSMEDNLHNALKDLYKTKDIFMQHAGNSRKEQLQLFLDTIAELRNEHYKVALEKSSALIALTQNDKVAFYTALRALHGMKGTETRHIEKETMLTIRGMIPEPKRLFSKLYRNPFTRGLVSFYIFLKSKLK